MLYAGIKHATGTIALELYAMKKLFTIAFGIWVLTSCSSPSKKQHEDRERRINELQNVGSGAIEKQGNADSAKITDSTQADTTGAK
jgi:hypothetical protein